MKIWIRPGFIAYILSMALLSSLPAAVSALIALMAHELAHIAAARAMGERFCSIELAPFGGVMIYEPGQSPSKGLRGMFVAAAGPLANEGMILMLASLCARVTPGGAPADLIKRLIEANTAMLIINLMPALPLDGGRILFCAGYYIFGVSALALGLCVAGVVLGIALCALAVYGAVCMGILNLSLLIVGSYLAVSALRGRDALLTENLYAVIHERPQAGGRVIPARIYRIRGDTPLYSLVPSIAKARACAFLLEEGAESVLLTEDAVRAALLDDPCMPAESVLSRNPPPPAAQKATRHP